VSRPIAWGGGLLLAGLATWWWLGAAAADGPSAAATPLPPPASLAASAAASRASEGPLLPGAGPRRSLSASERAEQISLWTQRLERSRQVRDSYRQATRYPPESRPLSEHPDQRHPFHPIEEDMPLRLPGAGVKDGLRLRTRQDRVFLHGKEAAVVSITAVDNNGQVLPLTVHRAVLHEGGTGQRGSSFGEAALQLHDDGSQGDAVAGDGTWTTTVRPSAQGFGELAGVLRLELALQSGDQAGYAFFDFIVSPDLPATWSGTPREALEAGTLNLYLPAQVRQAGRYVVTGRVDDAAGQAVALVNFNGEVGTGAQAFKLPLFGKLIRDLKPRFPLTLRDVEAFLLRPDAFPDRSMMARRVGTVLVTGSYPLLSFADAEWSSAERDRYLREYNKDVDQAEDQLRQLGQP
jgi:hypothetical protein